MNLTNAQKLTIKQWVIANNNSLFDQSSVALLNAAASPAFYVWNREVSVTTILDKLAYTNFTPNDDPNQATATAAQVWENRAMLIQIKQINLQMMLQGRDLFDATRASLRNGLQDCTENLPSGNNGNLRSGGWAAIQLTLSRPTTLVEKLLASGTGSQASPASLGTGSDGLPSEGAITLQNVIDCESAS